MKAASNGWIKPALQTHAISERWLWVIDPVGRRRAAPVRRVAQAVASRFARTSRNYSGQVAPIVVTITPGVRRCRGARQPVVIIVAERRGVRSIRVRDLLNSPVVVSAVVVIVAEVADHIGVIRLAQLPRRNALMSSANQIRLNLRLFKVLSETLST